MEKINESEARMVTISNLIEMLRSDIVKFEFEKKDGSVRVAYGTRNPKIIAAVIGTVDAKEGTKKPAKVGFVTYFDMEKGSFRCFAEERFLGVDEEHATYTPPTVSENKILDFTTFTMINESLDGYYDDEEECENCEEEE